MARSPVTLVIQSFNALTEDEKKLCLDFIAPEPEPEPAAKQTRKKRTTKSAKAQSLSSVISKAPKADADSNGGAESVDETAGPKCGVCGNPEDFQDHFKPSPHYHPFASSVASATRRSSRKGAAANSTQSSETGGDAALSASGD